MYMLYMYIHIKFDSIIRVHVLHFYLFFSIDSQLGWSFLKYLVMINVLIAHH